MISAGDGVVGKTCSKGMVFQPREGAVHPEEPEFCLEIEEVPQKAFMDFLKKNHPNEYKEVSKLLDENPIVKGDNKPAVYAKYGLAREYCTTKYKGGDLPTERQWENGCGDKEYCTKTGDKLKHNEARFSGTTWTNKGPGNVDWYFVNARGTRNQTGNVWEWMRDMNEDDNPVICGGSWYNYNGWTLRADYRINLNPDDRYDLVGFRCVASPQ